MRLFILDESVEARAKCARRLESFTQGDKEMLDLQVFLIGPEDLASKVDEADVLVLGADLGDRATVVARHALSLVPWLHVVMFVSDEAYGGGAFRAAHAVGVKKVLPESASPLDLLEELIAVHAEFRREGRTREGVVVAVTHAKGGVGATTIAAAMAEVCSVHHRRTMLWDLDVETRDLSRSLTVNGAEAKIVSGWINGTYELNRQTLTEALIPISSDVSVLMPPDRMAESMDLVCHTDGMNIVQRVLELGRVLFDVIIIDTAGRMGPAVGTLLRLSDTVLLVIDDTILGLTAVDLYLTFVKTLVGGTDRILFLVNPFSGALLEVEEIARELEPAHNLGPEPWRLPTVPNDPRAVHWPGSGRTLYSMGQKQTRVILEKIAKEVGLVESVSGEFAHDGRGETDIRASGWVKRMFGRKSPELQDDLDETSLLDHDPKYSE